MSNLYQDYITNTLNPVLTDLVKALLETKPEEPVPFMIDWIKKQLGINTQLSEREELKMLRQEYARLKLAGSEGEETESEEEELQEEELQSRIKKKQHRSAISAEAYGEWNKKEDFQPKEVPKTLEQAQKLVEILNQSFIFNSLAANEKQVVVKAMQERKTSPSETVISEGDDGNELFVVESGHLKCYKKIEGEEKLVKEYQEGDVFGELALLYNTPRAATIISQEESLLWSLDRECFNHIVKEATIKKREKYNEFLLKVSVLQEMDPYERSQLSDVLKSEEFNEGDYVIKQGEEGNVFYIVEEGKALATKSIEGQETLEVKEYLPGDYFGELALMRNEPRAANVIATTSLKVLSLDRHSFKRLLGPIEEILKRNAAKYEEVVKKLIG